MRAQLDIINKLLSDERSIEVEDEILARHQVIVYLNRSIASLEYLQITPGTNSTDNDTQINQLSFIKQKHSQLLQKRFEEVDLCLHQQKLECKKQEDNLLKHKTEAAKLGLTGTLQCSSFDTTRIRTTDASNEMYKQCLIEETFDDMKETLNGVHKNDRSLTEIKEDTRENNSLLRELISKVNAIYQLEHGPFPDMLMKVRTIGSANNEEMDGEMVAAGNGLLNGVQLTDLRGRQMQNALRPVVQSIEIDGNTVTRISHGCMAIHICCPTVNNLIALCEDFLNGKLTSLFQPLQDYLRTIPGNEDVVVGVDIFEKDYIKSIMPILNEVRQKLDIKLGELVSPSSVVQDNTLQNVREPDTTTPDENANNSGYEENDLNADSSDDDDEAKEINIETDVDEIDKGKEDKDVELFEYQNEIAREGCEGENVVIMAPTNSGKTYVGSRIMQVHLRRQKAQALLAKVIFLVENEALAFQQGKLFAEKLPAYRTKVFTGSVQREKQQYLWDFLASRDILVVTAQVLVNALKTGHIQSLTQFSLIVFDECHHSNKQHMYNEILWKYIEMKLQPGTDVAALPQVVGLTASLGVGGSTDWEAGLKHMKNILANMDAKFLCTVRNPVNKEELKKRTNCPIEEPVPVPHRAHNRFAEAIMDVVKQIDDLILESCDILDHATMDICRIPLGIFGTERYLQWNAEFVKNTIPGLRVDLIRRILNPCRRHLEAYNKALMIHKDARIMDAIRILEDFMKEFREVPEHVETDARLINFYDGMMLSDSFDDEPENPKLVKMGQILQDVLVADKNARGIIFVKTRELAKALVSWINETDYLKILQASEFVGQNAATSKGGMTKCKQKDALEYFKGGRHRVIIATSVAEEGLDIQKCNLVIRYEHVTNEIVRLQSRGRARADFSRYLVISEEGSWILDKEEKNRRCEELMNKIVPHLQAFIDDHVNLWENELLQLQTEMKEERDREKERRRLNMVNEVEFQCLNCSAFICMSDDIKCIKGAHHIITDPEADERLRLERDFVEPEGAEYGGQVYCAKVSCQVKLGSICTYKYMDFPLISLKAFRVVKPDGTGKSYKVWKKVPCEIADFTFDDLRDVIDIRLNNLV